MAIASRHHDILQQSRWMARGQTAVIAGVSLRRVWRRSGWYSVEGRPPLPGSEAADLVLRLLEARQPLNWHPGR